MVGRLFIPMIFLRFTRVVGSIYARILTVKKVVLVFLSMFILGASPVMAAPCSNPLWAGIDGCECTGVARGGGAVVHDVPSLGCLTGVVARMEWLVFTFLGTAALLVLLGVAIKFITSSCDPKGLEGAKKTMTYGIIGVVAILGVFILLNVVFKSLSIPNPLRNFSIYQNP